MAHMLRDIQATVRKELRVMSRDRHVVIYSVLLPLFLYPTLLWGTLQVLLYLRGVEERRESRVLLLGSDARAELRSRFAESPLLNVKFGLENDGEARPVVNLRHARELAQRALESGAVDVVVFGRAPPPVSSVALPGQTHMQPGRGLAASVFYQGASARSRKAVERVQVALEKYRHAELVSQAEVLGEDASFLEVVDVSEVDVATLAEKSSHAAALILPLLLLVMIVVGAFYPALDVTVGEKERGSLETTLITPINRSAIVLGKYVAVVIYSVIAFGLNFAGLVFTLLHLRSQLPTGSFALPWRALLAIIPAAILFSMLISSLMMLLAQHARTFKEGQSYVTPLYLLTVGTAVAVSSWTAPLGYGSAVIPVVNIELLFRDALKGELEAGPAIVTLVATAVFSAAVILFASAELRRAEITSDARRRLPFLSSLLARETG